MINIAHSECIRMDAFNSWVPPEAAMAVSLSHPHLVRTYKFVLPAPVSLCYPLLNTQLLLSSPLLLLFIAFKPVVMLSARCLGCRSAVGCNLTVVSHDTHIVSGAAHFWLSTEPSCTQRVKHYALPQAYSPGSSLLGSAQVDIVFSIGLGYHAAAALLRHVADLCLPVCSLHPLQ